MPTFDSSGFEINYIDEGSGRPIVLVHGFASNLHGNWRATGIADALVKSGRRVIALDARGHGRSGKSHDPEDYAGTKMADDVTALMDHLGIAKADLMGYSMGGGIAASQISRNPGRFTSAILAGVGDAVVAGNTAVRMNAIAEGMEADDPSTLTDATARGFRAFAERSGNDLGALAALQRSGRRISDPEGLGSVDFPVMVLTGTEDDLAMSCEKLVAAIPGARHVTVPGDHLGVFQHPEFTQEVLKFLGEVAPV